MKKILMILTVMLSTALYAEKEVKRVSVTLEKNNTLVLNDSVSDQSIAKLQVEFLELHSKLPRSKPIYLILNTPGGSVFAGARFLDTVRATKRKVHTITSEAASMGYVLVQELNDRLILGSGVLMHHRAKIGRIGGQLNGELESQLDFNKRFTDNFSKNAAKRIGVPLEEFKASLVNELWLFGEEAVRLNHADAIADALCGKSFEGTKVEKKTVQVFIFTQEVEAEFSNCPLITSPLGVKLDGREISPSELKQFNEQLKNKEITLQ